MAVAMLLFDMVGLPDKARAKAAVDAIRTRLHARDWEVYLVREAFFQRRREGLVAPEQVTRALGALEMDLCENFRQDVSLANFILGLLVSPEACPAFIAQLGDAFTERTARLPHVFAVEAEGEFARLVDAPRLPPKWRCLEGDSVVLTRDVWMAGEFGDNAGPAFPRGTSLTIAERGAYDGEKVRDCFLSVAEPAALESPISLVVPWSLVAHPCEWRAGQQREGTSHAEAFFQLPCWYDVREQDEAEARP
jgi:hypothetical protein